MGSWDNIVIYSIFKEFTQLINCNLLSVKKSLSERRDKKINVKLKYMYFSSL